MRNYEACGLRLLMLMPVMDVRPMDVGMDDMLVDDMLVNMEVLVRFC